MVDYHWMPSIMPISTAPLATSGRISLTHIPELDGIRGIAILMVIVYHAAQFAPHNTVETALIWAVDFAWSGVDLFFVLSGFLITGILLDTTDSPQYFSSFYGRRALRIFPLYYAILLLYFHVAVPLAHAAGYWPEITSQGEGWFWVYLTNWQAAVGHEYKNISHFWSLAVEEQFYLVWPAVVYVVPRTRLRWICVAMMGAALVLRYILMNRNGAWVFATPLRMDTLATGALVAILVRDRLSVPKLKRWLRLGVVASCMALAVVLYLAREAWSPTDYRTPYVRTFGLTLLCLIFASLVAHCGLGSGGKGAICRMMRARPLAFLGKYSYGIYVLHLFVTYYSLRVEKVLLDRLGTTWALPLAFCSLAVTLMVSSTIAVISWNLLERRCLKTKRYFPYLEAPVAIPGAVEAPAQSALGKTHQTPVLPNGVIV